MQTKEWPIKNEILQSITSFMPKCDLSIQLTLEKKNEEEDHCKETTDENFSSIKAFLIPIRTKDNEENNKRFILI